MIIACEKCGKVIDTTQEAHITLDLLWVENKRKWYEGEKELCEDCWETGKDSEWANYCEATRTEPHADGIDVADALSKISYIRKKETYHPSQKLKCQICKTNKVEHTVKDGSSNVSLCEKCFRCSKCGTNQAIAREVRNMDDCSQDPKGKKLYEGPICETCIETVYLQEKRQTNTNTSLHTHTHTASRL